MEFKNYYKTLGIPKTASDKEIKNAYRKLARKYHPDLNPGDKKAEEQFKVINEAYEVIGNPDKRKKYDDLGANWEQVQRNQEYARRYTQPGFEGRTTEDFDLGDFFETFFGGRQSPFGSPFGGAQTPRPASGEDIESEIELSIEDLVASEKKSIHISIPQICPQCKGEGLIPTTTAGGNRRRIMTMRTCPTCRGGGRVLESHDLAVTIPKGMAEGSRFRLVGQGGRGSGGRRNGDLYLRVKVRPHRVFRLEGFDLHADLPLLDYEAALGAKISVPTISGSVQLSVPPETQSKQSLRLKGQGLPRRGSSGKGNLYFHVFVYTPKDLSPSERKLYENLKRSRVSRNDAESIRKEWF